MAADDEEPATRPPIRAVLGLVAMIALIAAVVFIMYELRQSARMQDCLMSGRTNCAPITTGGR